MGQLATVPPPKLNGRYRIGQRTVVDAPSSDGSAPIPAVRGATTAPLESTLSCLHNRRSGWSIGGEANIGTPVSAHAEWFLSPDDDIAVRVP
jgi:hypothetical protein